MDTKHNKTGLSFSTFLEIEFFPQLLFSVGILIAKSKIRSIFQVFKASCMIDTYALKMFFTIYLGDVEQGIMEIIKQHE